MRTFEQNNIPSTLSIWYLDDQGNSVEKGSPQHEPTAAFIGVTYRRGWSIFKRSINFSNYQSIESLINLDS
jgi:hypothetical protein